MGDATSVIEVSEASFERDVLMRSREVPVVVEFWGAWCGPCRQLGPLLERLADEAAGGWVLAKVDVDANPALAQGFGIQGIPAVRAFKDGREVAEFVGALPEAQVRKWLEQLGPSEGDVLVEGARRAEEGGDLAGAADLYKRALALEPAHPAAKAGSERVDLKLRAESIDPGELRARLAASPADVEAAAALADYLMLGGDPAGAFAVLLDAVRVTSGEERDRARLHLLRLLDTVTADDPAALDARRRLAAAIF